MVVGRIPVGRFGRGGYPRRRAPLWRSFQRAARQSVYRNWSRNPAPVSARGKVRAARVRRARASTRNFTLPKFTLAQLNPFDRDAMHCRVPDESTAPSSSFYTYDEVAMSANSAIAGGAVVGFFLPSCEVYGTFANSVTTVTWAWAAAYGNQFAASKAAAISNQYALSRPVAHGIRITCPLAPTTTTGTVHVALYSMSTFGFATWTLPTSLPQLPELPYYRRVTLASLTQTPLVISNRYLDQTAFRYTAVQSTDLLNTTGAMFQVPNSWMGILIVVEGHGQAVGTPVINVENIGHYEGQSSWGGLTMDMPAEPSRPAVMEASARVTSHRDPVIQGTVEDMCANVARGAQDFMSSIVSATGHNAALLVDQLTDHATNVAARAASKPADSTVASGVLTGALASSLALMRR